jgi:hypothetical protein
MYLFFAVEHYFMIVKEFFGTQIINASFLFANSNISVKYCSKDFPSVIAHEDYEKWPNHLLEKK